MLIGYQHSHHLKGTNFLSQVPSLFFCGYNIYSSTVQNQKKSDKKPYFCASLGSILKRTRNNTENNANNETSIPVNVNSSVTPSKKRVRIVTPLEEVAQLKSTSLEKQLIPVYSNQKELCKDGLVGEQFQEYVMKEKTYVEVGKIVEVLVSIY